MTNERLIPSNPSHTKMWDALKAALVEAISVDKMSEREALAVTGKFVGLLIAIQDQRRGREVIIQELMTNIEQGNAEFIQRIFKDLGVTPS